MSNFRIKRNLTLLPIFTLLRSLRMTSLVQILYLAEILGSYTVAMGVFTIFSFTVSITEVPTGMISDRIGRVKSLSIATLCRFIAINCLYSSYYIAPLSFAILYAIFIGIAVSFGSGTDEAISFETVKQLKRVKAYPVFYGKVSSMRPLGLAISALLGGFLAHEFSYHFVILLDLIPIIICLLLCVILVEPNIVSYQKDKTKGKNLYKGDILKAWKAFTQNRKLKLISISKIIKMGLRNTVYIFENLYFEALIPMWLVGAVRFMQQICGAISFWFSGKILKRFGDMQVLLISELSVVTVKLFSIILHCVATPFIYVSSNLFTSVGLSSLNNLSQEEFSDEQRATMGSLVSLATNFASGLFCILAGVIADLTSLRTSMFILLIPNFLIIPLYKAIFKSKT